LYRITDFICTDILITRTVGVVGCVHTSIIPLIAGIIGTTHIVTARVFCTQAEPFAIAGIFHSTELAVITGSGIEDRFAITRFEVTGFVGAGIAVVKAVVVTLTAALRNGIAARIILAINGICTTCWETGIVCTNILVVTVSIIGYIVAGIGLFVTGIVGTVHIVITIDSRPGLTIGHPIAGLETITECPIIAYPVTRNIRAGIGYFVAGIDRAFHSVVAVPG
jgi:hypothetical protein